MAIVTAIINPPIPVKPVPVGVELRLNNVEAKTIMLILGRINGDESNSVRGNLKGIYRQLCEIYGDITSEPYLKGNIEAIYTKNKEIL